MGVDVSLKDLRERQRSYFHSGITRDLSFRRSMLDTLSRAIHAREQAIVKALADDLGKPRFEALTNEIFVVLSESNYARRRLRRWAKSRRVFPGLVAQPGRAWVKPEPYGSALVIAPWNYPFQLLMNPLVAAIAAGNTAILKPSEYAPATAQVVADLIRETFVEDYIAVVTGGPDVTRELIDTGMDLVFFTGSTEVGKKIMAAAAPHLSPVILELGGKSPAIVAADADLERTAEKIVWGKFNNAGQTCVAPDFVVVDREVEKPFLAALRGVMERFYGDDASDSPDFGRVVNTAHLDRLLSMIDGTEPEVGGNADRGARYLAPTLLGGVDWDHPVMDQEIFGPVLPVLGYDSEEELIDRLQARPRPLALYLFTRSARIERRILESLSFGGGGVNTAVMHFGSHTIPFGGIGASGMGRYHGRYGFEAFSHEKGILKQYLRLDPGLGYPGKQAGVRFLRWLMGAR